MRMLIKVFICFGLFTSSFVEAHDRGPGGLLSVCLSYLVKEHPYQIYLRKLSIEKLVREYRQWGGFSRRTGRVPDEFHMVYAIMMGRFLNGELSSQEKTLVGEAEKDYPYWWN